jgi:tetratricopeptide (TPR) repeat protein/predicted Ser/Thr protein kinase
MRHDTAHPIGAGGMGEVFKAWDPDLQRHVALKYLRHDDPVLVERLLREARAQARVDHPSVCKVYEVGEDDGRPFIAMEFVDGTALDAAARALSVEQKVLLIRKVAEAVQTAHSAGLIHRDLKPANILVADHDDQLHPYVLDFGIARIEELAGLTMTGQVMGTPGYLSPEQARGDLTAIDRRTDVFSLGVILYELLGGAKPFDGDSNVEILMHLIEDEPVPLRRVAPDVPRDLETVVMTCLEKAPDRRYPSARALADDLGRFLDGEPVEARALSLRQRLLRRARKNPVLSLGAVVSAVVIATLLVALLLGWVRYTRDLEQKEIEASEIAEFLVGIFEVSDPAQHDGETITAREVLERGAAKVEQELAGQPLARARLLNAIASAFAKLGLYDQAATQAQMALDLRLKVLGEHDLAVAESMDTLADIHRETRTFDIAEPLYRRSLAIRLAALDERDPAVATNQSLLAECLAATDQLDEAEELSRRSVEILQQAFGAGSPELLSALGIRAKVLRARGDMAAAEQLYLELLQQLRHAHGSTDPQVPMILNNLAYLLRQQGRLLEAEQRYREALAITEQLYGRSHPYSIQVLSNIATSLSLQGRIDEMLDVHRDLVSRAREHYPAGHWQTGLWEEALGRALMADGQLQSAEPELRAGLEIYQSALGDGHSWTACARGFLAACLFGLARTAQAEALARSSLADLEQAEELSRDNRKQLASLADLLEQLGQNELADRYRLLAAP